MQIHIAYIFAFQNHQVILPFEIMQLLKEIGMQKLYQIETFFIANVFTGFFLIQSPDQTWTVTYSLKFWKIKNKSWLIQSKSIY